MAIERKIWVVTLHQGKGRKNIIKSFSKYSTAIEYRGKESCIGASLKKINFIDENQSTLEELL